MTSILRRERGFTLIEILVVVIIIAIISSVSLMSINLIDDDRELATERKRLASLLEVVQDEAMLQGREFGLELMRSTYRFVEYDPYTRRWAEIVNDDLFRARQLPEGIEFELYLEDKPIVLEFEPTEIEDPDEDALSSVTETYAPHVFVFSSGELTPYEIHLVRPEKDQLLAMRGNLFGEIEFLEDQLRQPR